MRKSGRKILLNESLDQKLSSSSFNIYSQQSYEVELQIFVILFFLFRHDILFSELVGNYPVNTCRCWNYCQILVQ